MGSDNSDSGSVFENLLATGLTIMAWKYLKEKGREAKIKSYIAEYEKSKYKVQPSEKKINCPKCNDSFIEKELYDGLCYKCSSALFDRNCEHDGKVISRHDWVVYNKMCYPHYAAFYNDSD